MIEEPLVTVNILSFNRKDELRNTLTKVYEQDYKKIEVIVVDNASSDGSTEMVKKEFPEVQLIQIEKNIGIAGWNEGFKVAKGEYVLVLDDDSYPLSSAIRIGIKKLISNSNIAIIACKIVLKNEIQNFDKLANNLADNLVTTFTGCGAIIRKNIIDEVGGFEDELFIYFHEVEYSMRIINTGLDILLCPSSLVVHNISVKNRILDNAQIDDRKVFYDIRNLIVIIFLHFSFLKSIFLFIRIILGRIIFGIFKKKIQIVFLALKSALSKIILLRKKRNIISKSTQARYLYGSFAGGFFFFNSNYGLKRPKWLKLN
jgi:GT2 family glycosyltransferase